jgi:hypothetical protein
MQLALAIAAALHVLTAIFWAGSNFAAARPSIPGERLFFPQMGAALIAILSGGYLWSTLHAGSEGPMERALEIGAISAILALLVQLVLATPVVVRLRSAPAPQQPPSAKVKLSNRLASLLLAIAAVCMAAARYQ